MRTSVIIVSILFLLAPMTLLAQEVQTGPGGSNQTQTGPGGSGTTLINPLAGANCGGANGNCLQTFLINILNFIVNIGSIIVVLMLVFIGFKFVTAQGNDSKLTEARNMLLWTIVGGLILLGAKVIAMGIQATVQALTTG